MSADSTSISPLTSLHSLVDVSPLSILTGTLVTGAALFALWKAGTAVYGKYRSGTKKVAGHSHDIDTGSADCKDSIHVGAAPVETEKPDAEEADEGLPDVNTVVEIVPSESDVAQEKPAVVPASYASAGNTRRLTKQKIASLMSRFSEIFRRSGDTGNTPLDPEVDEGGESSQAKRTITAVIWPTHKENSASLTVQAFDYGEGKTIRLGALARKGISEAAQKAYNERLLYDAYLTSAIGGLSEIEITQLERSICDAVTATESQSFPEGTEFSVKYLDNPGKRDEYIRGQLQSLKELQNESIEMPVKESLA